MDLAGGGRLGQLDAFGTDGSWQQGLEAARAFLAYDLEPVCPLWFKRYEGHLLFGAAVVAVFFFRWRVFAETRLMRSPVAILLGRTLSMSD